MASGQQTTSELLPAPAGHPTAPHEPSRGWTRFEQGLRLFAYVVIFGVVIGALFGLTGLRTREAVASNDDLTVVVTFAQITRPGIATPFVIDISSATAEALPDELTVEVSSEYLAMFDENGLDPEPETTMSDGAIETWTFRPDGATRMSIDFDARLQPNIHSGTTGTVSVTATGTGPVDVEFRTWVWP